MQEFLTNAGKSALGSWWHVLWVSAVFLALELLWPASRYSMKSRIRAGMFWAIYYVITMAFFTAFLPLWSKLGIKPLFTLNLEPIGISHYWPVKVLGWIAVPLIAGAVSEFFYYWFHRAQHSFAWMWRFHSVHHSLREMSTFNSNHHFTEEILRTPFILVPMTFLIGVTTGPTLLALTILIRMQGQFEHSCTKINLGIFRYLVADNRFHRIHHSLEQRHWNRNFGSFMPLWDIVFRTATFPRKGEWPPVGLDHVDEPKTINDFLFRPFLPDRPSAPIATEEGTTLQPSARQST